MRAITLGLGLIVSLGFGAGAQTLSTNNARSLSLDECIKQALERNLGLRIARVDVRGARSALLSSYGYYDPTFNIDARYTSTTQEEDTFDFETGAQPPAGERTSHHLINHIVGNLPWGMNYDIGNDISYLNYPPRNTNFPNLTSNYDLETGIVLAQPLLRDFWIDQGRAQIKLNRADIRISEFALRRQINTVVRDVMLNYYELIFARENVGVFEKALELSQRLAAENKKRVEVGTMAPLEEKQAEAQAATARANLLVTMRQLAAQENVLINLITDNYEEWQNLRMTPTESLVAVPQSYSLQGSWVSALTFRPDFNELKEEMERQGIEVRLAQNQVFPQLDLVGSYGRAGIDRGFSGTLSDIHDDRLPRYSFGVVLSVPLGNRGARGKYGQAKTVRDRLALQVKELHQNILVQVEDAVAAAQSDFERAAATREAAAAAGAAYDAEVKKLENGKSTSFNVLSLQNDLTVARSRQIRALADYNRSLADLYFNEGTILEKRRITVEK